MYGNPPQAKPPAQEDFKAKMKRELQQAAKDAMAGKGQGKYTFLCWLYSTKLSVILSEIWNCALLLEQLLLIDSSGGRWE